MPDQTRAELERELAVARDDLAEVEEMRLAVLGQTGVHLGAKELNRYNSRFDGDLKRAQERITQLEAQLAALEAPHS